MTNILTGVIAGILCKPWWSGVILVFIICFFIGNYRVISARKAILIGDVNEKTKRHARNLLLVCGCKDSPENVISLIISRKIPPITFAAYGRAIMYELAPAVLVWGITVGIRLAIR